MTEFIIFPLGSELVKNRNRDTLRSFLFYGPPGTGKTFMVRCIVTSVNAMLIDFSPLAIEGRYQERKGEEKMIACAMTQAKIYQPTIIYVDEAEKVWPKKPRKGVKKKDKRKLNLKDPNNPARIKKPFLKWVKKWIDDKARITILGCTSYPEEGSKTEFKKFFEK